MGKAEDERYLENMRKMNEAQEKNKMVVIGDKPCTFMPTPTKLYLQIQTRVQNKGAIDLLKYAEQVLLRVSESYDIDEFTPNEIQDLIEAFDNFCNAPRNKKN